VLESWQACTVEHRAGQGICSNSVQQHSVDSSAYWCEFRLLRSSPPAASGKRQPAAQIYTRNTYVQENAHALHDNWCNNIMSWGQHQMPAGPSGPTDRMSQQLASYQHSVQPATDLGFTPYHS